MEVVSCHFFDCGYHWRDTACNITLQIAPSHLCSDTVLILFIHHHGHHLLESRGEGDNAIEYVHLIPSPTTHSSRSRFVHLLKRDFSAWRLCMLSTMIVDDDTSVASKDMIERENQWRKKKKEEAKQSAQNQLRDWMSMMTIDDIVLCADGTTITKIDTKPKISTTCCICKPAANSKSMGPKTKDEMRQSDYSLREKGSN